MENNEDKVTQELDKNHLEQLNKAYFESSAQFDKQVLFVASGALGISLAFIKDIVQVNSAIFKAFLLLSWLSFSLVIIFSVISHYTSLKAINFKLLNLFSKNDRKSKKLNGFTKSLNFLMIIFLILGFFLFFLFISLNI